MPVSGADDAKGRAREQVGEERTAGKERDGTPQRDTIRDGMVFCANTQNRQALEPNVTHAVLTRKMCACMRAVRCSVYTPPSRSRLLLLAEREI